MTTTAIAPTNIAVLKYWGKNPAFEEYFIPTKSSLSFTVGDLVTRTTLKAMQGSGKIDFTLNGNHISQKMKEFDYVNGFVQKAGRFYPFLKSYDYVIASENNFPTSAGFASSASGFAALVKALAGEVKELDSLKSDEKGLTTLARLGSGSATRSVPTRGGFVIWHRGPAYPNRKGAGFSTKVSDSSYAETLFDPQHWPELTIFYVRVEAGEKKVKSRAGMNLSVTTNPLYDQWVSYEEGIMKEQMISSVQARDFKSLGEHIMKASNNLHQICLGTYPPIIYLNQTSFLIMESIHEMNLGGLKAAYTFDAGPNAVVFCLDKDANEVERMLGRIVGKECVRKTRMGPGARLSENHLI